MLHTYIYNIFIINAYIFRAAIHLEREILRASQDVTVKEAELQSVLKDKERLEKK